MMEGKYTYSELIYFITGCLTKEGAFAKCLSKGLAVVNPLGLKIIVFEAIL